MNKLYTSLIVLLLVSICSSSFGQVQKDLERKKKKIDEQIEFSKKLISQAKKAQKESMVELLLLNNEIENRTEKISIINRQIRHLNKQIHQKEQLIVQKEKELVQLKKEYAKMIYYAYKTNNSYDKIMFIFSSDDFYQAIRRLKYYQQYAKYREKQAELIEQAKRILSTHIKDLEKKKSKKRLYFQEEQSEKTQLLSQKKKQQNTYSSLQKKEKGLKAKIKKKEKEKAKLQKAIQRLIEEEIRKAKAKRGTLTLTPEAKALSNSFTKNKGNLPWPVEKGIITMKFGTQQHPIYKSVKIDNQGIDLATSKGSTARSVFEGTVTAVIIIPGQGKAVMILHGDYYTVYSNLQETFVQKGDKVTTKQTIGTIITDENAGKTELHFQIIKIKTPLNPTNWLFKAK